MSAATAPIPDTTCPACHKIIVRPAREPGRVQVRNRFLLIDANGGAVIGCPNCPAELEVQAGKLLVFRTRNFDGSGTRVVPRRS